MSYHWIPAETYHVESIAARCRKADVDELWASAMMTPQEALHSALELCPDAMTGVVDDVPVCMFGVTPWSILGRTGAPWMIGTTDIREHAKSFLRGSKAAIKVMEEPYDTLVNMVDARHLEAVAWLRWLGFTIHEAIPYGPFGLPFHPFEKRRV